MLCRAADSLLLVVDIQTRLAAAMPAADLQRVPHASGILLQAASAAYCAGCLCVLAR